MKTVRQMLLVAGSWRPFAPSSGAAVASSDVLPGSAQTETPGMPDRLTAGCVWLGWILLSFAAFWFVAEYARNVPFWDEFCMAPVLTHEQPVTPAWLWSQHSEHRIPLPRLIQVGLAKITNTDFRAGMYLNVALMCALSAQLITTARKLRGCYSYTDLFFPLALLHWGNYENLLWSFQVAFSVSTWLTTTLLILIVGNRGKLSARQTWLAGALLIALSLCGAQGAATVLLTSAWLAWGELSDARRNGRQLAARLGRMALPLAACTVVCCSFLASYRPPPAQPHAHGWKAMRTALEFFGVGLGQATRCYWPFPQIVALALFGTVLLSFLPAWKARAAERFTLVGLLLFLGGMVVLAVAIGKGRAYQGVGAGCSPRYTWLAAPICFWAYLASTRFMRPAAAGLIQGGLLLSLVFFAKANFREGQEWAADHFDVMTGLERDIRAGVCCQRLANRYASRLSCSAHDLELLRNAGLGPYRGDARLIPQAPIYPMFDPQPRSVSSWFGVVETECEGKLCLIVHNPGLVTFDLTPSQRRIKGLFGIAPPAYLGTKPTDGVEFVVEWVSAAGERSVLWRRFLDPANVPADRGMHELRLELPDFAPGASLELKTTDLPGHKNDWDWSYWTDLRLE
jgi:hypothetical protein